MKLNLTNAIYNDEDKAREHLEKLLWPDGPVCPHCGSAHVTKLEGKAHRKGLHQCNNKRCRKQISVTVGTVFERSKVPLNKWVLAAHLMGEGKKGTSAKQIERSLGVSYRTAWFIMHRLREAMNPEPISETGPLGGKGKIVQSDETFVGGKAKNAHKSKPIPPKRPVVALVEPGGKMRAKHVANVTANSVREVLVTQVSRKSELHTDDSLVYYHLGKEFAKHRSVNHSRDEYVGPHGETTNDAESFFAILKRGIMGSFHSVSEQHLQRYATEFEFRWNHREALGVSDKERIDAIIKGAAGKRLTYRRINEAANA